MKSDISDIIVPEIICDIGCVTSPVVAVVTFDHVLILSLLDHLDFVNASLGPLLRRGMSQGWKREWGGLLLCFSNNCLWFWISKLLLNIQDKGAWTKLILSQFNYCNWLLVDIVIVKRFLNGWGTFFSWRPCVWSLFVLVVVWSVSCWLNGKVFNNDFSSRLGGSTSKTNLTGEERTMTRYWVSNMKVSCTKLIRSITNVLWWVIRYWWDWDSNTW